MGVQTVLDGLSYFVSSFIVKNNEYFFLDTKEYFLDGDEITLLNKFIIESIKAADRIYSSTSKFISLDSSYKVNECIMIDDQEYRIILTVSAVIRELLEHIDSSVLGTDDINQWVLELKKKYDTGFYSLAESTEDVLDLLEKELTNSISICDPSLLLFLNAVALSANFFSHVFMGQKFIDKKELHQKMCSYLYKSFHLETEDDDPFEGWSNYQEKKDVFELFFSKPTDYIFQFWSAAKKDGENTKQLAKFAIELLRIPAAVRPISLDSMKKICFFNTSAEDYLSKPVLGFFLLN